MSYTEIHATRVLARKLFEVQHGDRGYTWLNADPPVQREYEKHVEKLFDLKDEETRDAILHLLNRS